MGSDTLVGALRSSHDLTVHGLARVAAGETTRNFTATDPIIGRVFVKVYTGNADLSGQERAIQLSEFAAAGGIPTAPLIPDRQGRPIASTAGLAYSVWRFIDAPSGQDTGLTPGQMADMGSVLGRLHHRLGQHPVTRGASRRRASWPDPHLSTGLLRTLSNSIDPHDEDPFRTWARGALQQRVSIVDRVAALASDRSDWSAQVIHGDLASPNVLLTGDSVAAVIDFQPPTVDAVAHDISRIGCDPRTVLRLGPQWPQAFTALTAEYRRANPAVPAADVTGAVRWWLCYTAASTYPLRTLLAGESPTDGGLARYAQQRHAALLAVLEVDELLR